MGSVRGKHAAQVLLAEDQHLVGDLGSDGQHETFGEAVRAWTPGRDLDLCVPRTPSPSVNSTFLEADLDSTVPTRASMSAPL
jgi:hypothetical protein